MESPAKSVQVKQSEKPDKRGWTVQPLRALKSIPVNPNVVDDWSAGLIYANPNYRDWNKGAWDEK
jgi:hypothetical protein